MGHKQITCRGAANQGLSHPLKKLIDFNELESRSAVAGRVRNALGWIYWKWFSFSEHLPSSSARVDERIGVRPGPRAAPAPGWSLRRPGLKGVASRVDGRAMERFIGLVLFVAAIWVAATVATEGLDQAFGGIFAGESRVASGAADASTGGDAGDATSRRRPITERVRDRVQADVDAYSERVGAE